MVNDDKRLWQMQFTKPVFAKFGDLELLIQTQVLVAKISVITGWNLVEDETYMQVLYDQFSKKLREEYYSINSDEAEYAFRKFGTTVEDWGKNFNLNLVDKVLSRYLHYRAEIREFVERVPNDAIKSLPMPEQIQTDKEFIEESFMNWFGLKNRFYQFVDSPKVYDKLVAAGLLCLTDDDKTRIRNAVKAENDSMVNNNRFEELCHRLAEIKEAPQGQYSIRLCKKYAVAEFFNKLIEQGKLKVF